MEKKLRLLLTFIFVIILVAVLYIFTNWFSIITGYFTGEDEKLRLVGCLNGLGAEFYSSSFCADCEKQKEMLGNAFKQIRQIDCGPNKENCPNIKEIPAWYINRNIYYGFKNISELKNLGNCE